MVPNPRRTGTCPGSRRGRSVNPGLLPPVVVVVLAGVDAVEGDRGQLGVRSVQLGGGQARLLALAELHAPFSHQELVLRRELVPREDHGGVAAEVPAPVVNEALRGASEGAVLPEAPRPAALAAAAGVGGEASRDAQGCTRDRRSGIANQRRLPRVQADGNRTDGRKIKVPL